MTWVYWLRYGFLLLLMSSIVWLAYLGWIERHDS
jgi:hypothetical protein